VRCTQDRALLRAGAATAGQSEFDCLRNCRAEAATLLASALEPRTVTSDDVIDHIIAPITYRAIYLPWTLTDSTAAGLVEDLFRPH
jgi:hypothetical protein